MPADLPSWDLGPAPGNGTVTDDTPELVLREVDELTNLYQRHAIAGGPLLPPSRSLVDIFEQLLTRTGDVLRRERLLCLWYAGRCWAGGERLEANSAEYLRVQQQLAPVTALRARLEAWAARLPLDWLTASSAMAVAHRRWLQQCHAGRWMSAAEEELLADLDSAAAATAWRRLYEDSAARVTASLATAPVASPQNQVDRASAVWAGVAPVAAACLNAILGQEWIVAERRGWDSLLDIRLHREGLDAQTVAAARRTSPALLAVLHRFAVAKALLLGQETIAYGQIGAPLPGEMRWSWDDATELIIESFTACDPGLGDLAAVAFRQRWIDAAPRPGKRTMALCLPLGDGQARIMVTFDGSAESVLRLGHELGHAFHHVRQTGQTEWQRESPLLLMELAAMSAEQVIVSSTAPSEAGQTALLGAWLARVFRTCVLGLSRWQFEDEVSRQRRGGPLAEADFDAAASRSQQFAYAAGITAGTAPRHAWISHPHLYTARFAGVPYVLARVAAAATFPEGSNPHLPSMLTNTGLTTPSDIFAGQGHDLSSAEFWSSGNTWISAHIDQFISTTAAGPPMAASSSGGSR